MEEKYRKAVEALQEIAIGRGPFKVDPNEFARSVLFSNRDLARETLRELGEAPEEGWKE